MRRDHLRHLAPEFYRGDAAVHWTITMRGRKTGWLDTRFLYRFRELMTHSQFRFSLACPVFCLMPDHMHFVWLSLSAASDQLLAVRHFRARLGDTLGRIGFELQDQAYDSVLSPEERAEDSLLSVCEYIARNPERAGLVEPDGYASYPFTGCVVPGYPEMRLFEDDSWLRLFRTISHLRNQGVLHPGDRL